VQVSDDKGIHKPELTLALAENMLASWRVFLGIVRKRLWHFAAEAASFKRRRNPWQAALSTVWATVGGTSVDGRRCRPNPGVMAIQLKTSKSRQPVDRGPRNSHFSFRRSNRRKSNQTLSRWSSGAL
jgi:hypothetical protein